MLLESDQAIHSNIQDLQEGLVKRRKNKTKRRVLEKCREIPACMALGFGQAGISQFKFSQNAGKMRRLCLVLFYWEQEIQLYCQTL